MERGTPILLEELHALFSSALAGDAQLTFIPRAGAQHPGPPDSFRLYFAARCTCGVAALLTIDVSRSKTAAEVREALPYLLAHLRNRARMFYGMSCQRHAAMRSGPSQPSNAGPGP